MSDYAKEKWNKQKSFFGSETIALGKTYSYLLLHRPKQFFFTLARYKFALRLIGETPSINILELGCNEGIGTLLFKEQGHKITAVDFDEEAILWAKENLKNNSISFFHDDFLNKKYGNFDAVISIDVIEHVNKNMEKDFFCTVISNLTNDGICIIGTPNLSAAKYASETSKAGHINLYDMERLRDTMKNYFKNVMVFGMNDEMAHTGFYPMCHYLFVIGCGVLKKGS